MAVGVLAILVLGLVFGLRPSDPAQADPVRTLAVQRQALLEAERAEAALTSLAEVLQAALEETRRGTAALRVGGETPGARLIAAAEHLAPAQRAVAEAETALERLEGTLQATPASRPRVSLGVTAGQLNAIAAQLQGAAAISDSFAQMRRSAEGALGALDRALSALHDKAWEEALAAGRDAGAHLEIVRRWEQALPTLPLWLDTAQALTGALGEVARAQLAGDDDAATAAGQAYLAAAADARRADQSLALALAEGGSAVMNVPMQQLAAALGRTEEAREAVSSVRLGLEPRVFHGATDR